VCKFAHTRTSLARESASGSRLVYIYIYINIYIKSSKVRLVTLHTRTSLTNWNPSPAGLASQTRTCMGTFTGAWNSTISKNGCAVEHWARLRVEVLSSLIIWRLNYSLPFRGMLINRGCVKEMCWGNYLDCYRDDEINPLTPNDL
jgi:hypothetical protein